MDKVGLLIKCFNSPRLYQICKDGLCVDYYATQQTVVEKWSNMVFDGYSWLITIVTYLSPFIVYNAYKHGLEGPIAIGKLSFTPLITLYVVAFILRGSARCVTPAYTQFLESHTESITSNSNIIRQSFLNKYDFDFSEWNVDMKATAGVTPDSDIHGQYYVPLILKPFYYFMATWIAKPLAYPGATYPINAIMRKHLSAGRASHMLMRRNMTRAKLETIDNNHIDSVFVDNRAKDEDGTPVEGPGQTLVITCEGNAAYYEVGAFEYPLKEGYSAMGWNHPGFGYSTGIPYGTADGNAIEAVYEYATKELGFAPKDIAVYGWSIGGFSASYLANAHPDIGNVIIDASFDDILPLAIPRMPEWLGSVTNNCCRKYFNLHNVALLPKYQGPIRLIRRNGDEIISTNGHASGNRGNQLLMAVLQSRYPVLFKDQEVASMAMDWLDQTSPVPRRHSVPGYDLEFCKEQLSKSTGPPDVELGTGLTRDEKLILAYYLFSKHLTDCEGGHNNPLPRKYFKMPWKKSDDLTP